MISVGIMEVAWAVAVSVATWVSCRLAFDGIEPIPSRDGGIIDYPGRSRGRTDYRKPNCTDNPEHFVVRTPPKDYLLGDKTHLINA